MKHRQVVIGGDYYLFRRWCLNNRLAPQDVIYADSAEKLMGFELKPEDVVDLGGAPADVREILPTRFR